MFNQNLNRAFVLFELTPANKISFLDSYKKPLRKCCIDPLRPPRLSGCGIAGLSAYAFAYFICFGAIGTGVLASL